MKRFLTIIYFASSVFLVSSQTVLQCNFEHLSATNGIGYGCDLENIQVARETDRVIITGNHQQGLTNNDVIRVTIRNSQTEFILTQLFGHFPNLENLEITNGGLRRIQHNAFAGARNLRTMAIQANNIGHIQPNAFINLPNLDTLVLRLNNIQNIDQNAFNGLTNVRNLFVNNEQITALHQNTLRPLVNLVMVSFANNLIERLDAQIFMLNRNLHSVFFESNKINAINPQFVNNLHAIQVLSLSSNPCVNQVFITRIITPTNMITLLNRCIANWR